MDALTLYGALAVSTMLVFYTLEDRAAVFVLGFAGACVASSAYGFCRARGRSAWWSWSGPR
jgi:hypothetical protein